jgi:hypothetical protein
MTLGYNPQSKGGLLPKASPIKKYPHRRQINSIWGFSLEIATFRFFFEEFFKFLEVGRNIATSDLPPSVV